MKKTGISASCFVKKYTSVLYIPLKCSLKKIGTSRVKTLITANMLENVIFVMMRNKAPLILWTPSIVL